MAVSDLPLALTQGDPAGIGPDLALSVWSKRAETTINPFLYVGCPRALAERAALLGITAPIIECDAARVHSVFPDAIPVLPVPSPVVIVPGHPDPLSAPSTIGAIETAVGLVHAGEAAGLVTNPIAKSVLYAAGFRFPGHTEFLADVAERLTGKAVLPVMLLAGPKLKTIPVTIHIPLKDVPAALTSELIDKTCRVADHDLRHRFGIARPRLALAGLNPHAGEDGALGTEDRDLIAPVVKALQDSGIDAVGPLPADTMFHEDARRRYDVAICMYHDQALIPAKALGFDDAVNVTLGLPFVRTSPDHGTALSLAGHGTARDTSLLAALRLARSMSDGAREI